ncbi:MAG: hypothetical protein ACXWUE_19350 [Polyangiales bacterium]
MSVTLERLRLPLVVLGGGLVIALHVRNARRDAYLHREASIPAHANARLVAVRIAPEPHVDLVEVEIKYADDARSPTELTLPFGAGAIFGVQLHDSAGKQLPIKAEGFREQSKLVFDLPAERTVVVGFQTSPPLQNKTFGWGHRAIANDWVPNLTEARIPLSVAIEVPSGTSAPGFRCSTGPVPADPTLPAPRVCSSTVRSRRTIALPVEPYEDALHRIAFASAIGAVISTLMYAIYRRWSDLAYAMGARDEDLEKGPVTLDELAVEYRRVKAQRREEPEPEVDPLEAVALVARGITSVLSVIGSLFLVSHFNGGLFPLSAPLALMLWAIVAGGVVIVATGIDRARPWLGLALLCGVAAIALHPLARWVVPGLVPTFAGVLMQFTSKR